MKKSPRLTRGLRRVVQLLGGRVEVVPTVSDRYRGQWFATLQTCGGDYVVYGPYGATERAAVEALHDKLRPAARAILEDEWDFHDEEGT